MLIEDVFVIENLQVLNEGKNGPMKVRGVFQRADEENNNGRIYPKALLEREITKLTEAMKGRRLMGELDHPQHDSVKLSNVSHLITKLEAKGNEIIGEAEILDTPMGKVAKALIEGGVQVGISSRGMGTLSEGQDGKRYVNEDFRLITWDLVADPSTRGAFPGLSESTNLNSMLVEEILNDVLPKVTKQKVFSTLLEETLNEKRNKKPLVGRQHVLDKNKNGKLDSQDFKMMRRQDSSTLFNRVGDVLGESDSAIRARNKEKLKMRRQRQTAEKNAAEDSGVYEGVIFPRVGMMFEEAGILDESWAAVGKSVARGGVRVGRGLKQLASQAIKTGGKTIRSLGKSGAKAAGYIAGAIAGRGKGKEDSKKPDTTPDKPKPTTPDTPKPTTPDKPKPTTPDTKPDSKQRALGSMAKSNIESQKGMSNKKGDDARKKALGSMAKSNIESQKGMSNKKGPSKSRETYPQNNKMIQRTALGSMAKSNIESNKRNKDKANREAQMGPDDTGKPRRENSSRFYTRIGQLLGEAGSETPEEWAKKASGMMAKGQDPGIGAPKPKKKKKK